MGLKVEAFFSPVHDGLVILSRPVGIGKILLDACSQLLRLPPKALVLRDLVVVSGPHLVHADGQIFEGVKQLGILLQMS